MVVTYSDLIWTFFKEKQLEGIRMGGDCKQRISSNGCEVFCISEPRPNDIRIMCTKFEHSRPLLLCYVSDRDVAKQLCEYLREQVPIFKTLII